MTEKTEKVKKLLEGLLTRLGVKFDEISLNNQNDSSGIAFIIKSPESGLIIGTRGANISAINHLIKRMVGKLSSDDEEFRFYIDVNDYHDKLLEEIQNKAKILADRARSFEVNIEMEPMSSYERMIIHTYFENVSDIETESKGVGSKRRVILKYIGAAGTKGNNYK